MKKYSRLFRYLAAYKGNIALYFLFVILAIVFSVVSIGSLPFFLDLIFTQGKQIVVKPATISSSQDLINFLSYQLQELMATKGKIYVLAVICVMVIFAVLLKNVFTYLSYYILAPMRNGVMNRLRKELFHKILMMPIGYFTEQRKGDIMSRMTNDVGELENSVVGTVEGFIKDPISIIFFFSDINIYKSTAFFVLTDLFTTYRFYNRQNKPLFKKTIQCCCHKAGRGTFGTG
jgi:subfamily B ATP-binding cassette protein MsbA